VLRIETTPKANRIRRISAVDVRVVLQQECLDIAPHPAAAIAEHVGILVPLLRAFDAQYKHVSCSLKNLMDEAIADSEAEEHVRLLRSLPGIGLDVSTTLLAEAGGVLADADGRAFRCYAGIAPITKQSGKSRRLVPPRRVAVTSADEKSRLVIIGLLAMEKRSSTYRAAR
jgi:transposase